MIGVCWQRQSQSFVPAGLVAMDYHPKFAEKLPASAAILFAAALLLTTERSYAQANLDASTAGPGGCIGDSGGITLSPGFCATVFADKLGHARHLAVAANGVVYANTWSGRYYHNDTPPAGGFLVALKDTKGAGRGGGIGGFGEGGPQG